MDEQPDRQGVVMRLCGLPSGQPTPFDGQFLKAFDFEANAGVGEIEMTADIAEAKRFADAREAMEFYRRSPECRPKYPTGRPNRPLTSTNWSFEKC